MDSWQAERERASLCNYSKIIKEPKILQSGNAYVKWNLTEIIKNDVYSLLWARSAKPESDQEETADKPKLRSVVQHNWTFTLRNINSMKYQYKDLGTVPD